MNKKKILSIHKPLQSSLNKSASSFIPALSPIQVNGLTNTYLLAFRTWKRAKQPNSYVTKPGQEGHPWYNLWGFSKYDGTGFAIVQITNSNVKIVKVKQYPSHGSNKIDMRLLSVPGMKNTYFCTYNTFGKKNPVKSPNNFKTIQKSLISTCFYYFDKKKVYHNPSKKLLMTKKVDPNNIQKYTSWESYCTFQNISVLRIGPNLQIEISKPLLVCPQVHQKVEKNISMMVHKNSLFFQYTVNPWVFLNESCAKVYPKNSDLFKHIVDYYDASNTGYFKRFLQFSCSTPLVPFNDKEYIAAGHFKIVYKDIEQKSKGKLLQFIQKAKQLMRIKTFDSNTYPNKVHYELIYGMFIYTVKKSDLQLSRTSGGFILFDDPNLLTFPTSVVYNESLQKYMIAYHENDIAMKLWMLSVSDMEKLLVFNSRTKPADFTFTFR